MNRLRNRLILAFLAATVLPLAATVWITTSLLDRSLGYATTGELDRVSRTLEATVRQFYQREREALKTDALAGRAQPVTYLAADAGTWPESIRAFWESSEAERFGLSGPGGDHVDYLRRRPGEGAGVRSAAAPAGVDVYTRDLRGLRMEELSAELRATRQRIGSIDSHDLRRGFTLTLLVLLGAAWLISLAPLIYIAHRTSRPIRQLTEGLTAFADGDWSRRLENGHSAGAARDEVGRAVGAFNRMADQLRASRERLLYLAQVASWQSLARKTAHELKNSLTPIRLTIEEVQARLSPTDPADRAFIDQAVQIVVCEIDSLERRVRAFSDYSSEPPIHPELLDVNGLVAERVALLRPAHAATVFDLKLDPRGPRVYAGADLVKGILTNVLQNAAEAAGSGGLVRVITRPAGRCSIIEVHDSGPGLSADAAATLFEPTITFKEGGMGLGLSIAKRDAVVSGGDVALITGQLGGAAFGITLPDAAGSARPERL
ncbi:MAG TPA: HAMP domain-containing sensor histidine kinase [Vicinamibacterales bacterium]|nr:HAMP domain-containing sensor histidine kinase [Vicinamibacterales bacterium]